MCDHCQDQCKSDDGGSFTFGLVFGLIIAAIVAVLIYRQDKGKTFEMLSKKLEEIFKKFSEECSQPKTVSKPKLIAKKTTKK